MPPAPARHPYAFDRKLRRDNERFDRWMLETEQDELAEERAANAAQPFDMWADPDGGR